MTWRRYVPFGLAVHDKPRHYREMLRIAWQNRDSPRYALRILRHGVCDGCSLGPRGLQDDVMPGTHLCLTRLNLLRLNTMPAMREEDWSDLARLRALSNEGLRVLGRVPYPLLAERGASGFRRISWDEAVARAAGWLRETEPDRTGWFVTSRGLTNETYYVVQKLARLYGTNNVDLCSRLCHAPSVAGLKATIGYGAPTCSLSDLVGTDLLVLVGTDLANNQPVTMKYIHEAKKRGTRVVVVNPVREPGLERYWIPSVPSSALWGTRIMDDFYRVSVGGDVAFATGALKALVERGGVDRAWVDAHTTGWDALEAHLRALRWEDLEESSGLPRAEMERFARQYAEARTAVVVWSMGITQHANGSDNVRALVNLVLARGMVGREKCGLMPIRGHSGVQGGGECGVDPHRFPGSQEVDAASAARFAALWGHAVPDRPGLMTGEMMEAVLDGRMDLLYLVGGNLRETMPDPRLMERALGGVRYRIHQDIVLNTSTLVEPGEAVLVLPGQTRYEQRSGGSTTSTERRVRFTPEIPGPRIGEARPEWEIPALLGRALGMERAFAYADTRQIRQEMAEAIPFYAGVERLAREGDSFQWGGPQLCTGGVFDKMPGGRARFSVVPVPTARVPPDRFRLSTRRGKQFNSIVFRANDPQMGDARRDDVLVAAEDATRLGLAAGERVLLRSDTGEMEGTLRLGDVPPRHVVVYWPESNVLIAARYDPEAGIPDYNALVALEKVKT